MVGLDRFDGIPREREREKGEAYNPIDMDSLRASNGRSSSEPDGTYGKVVSVKAFDACIASPLTVKSKPYVKLTSLVVFTQP